MLKTLIIEALKYVHNLFYRRRSRGPSSSLEKTPPKRSPRRPFFMRPLAIRFLHFGPRLFLRGFLLSRGLPSKLSFIRGWVTPLYYNIRARVEVFRFAIFLKCLFRHFNRFPSFLKTLHFHFDNSFIF